MKIVIAGNYGAGNLGDEMILEGMIKIIKSSSPDSEITALSASPEETSKKHNINS
ncbi:polysaccharide pyruvyl transferase CsaB, partial [Candidatus Peregrinibacteria bacterium]|nr:polysaccharide pyruvyl transferase CsaB [Candidatus Peregrinibacteria bacterium]